MREPEQSEAGAAEADWAPPLAQAAVAATVRLPGSKSITNRALILAALAETPTEIIGPLRARDTDLMANAIVALGGTVETSGPGATSANDAGAVATWTVTPGRISGQASVDVGNAGT